MRSFTLNLTSDSSPDVELLVDMLLNNCPDLEVHIFLPLSGNRSYSSP